MLDNMYDKLKTYIDIKINNIRTSLSDLFQEYKVKDVGNNIDNINIVASIKEDVDRVNDIADNVVTVSNISKDVSDVASVKDDVVSVGSVYLDVHTLAPIKTDIKKISENWDDIDLKVKENNALLSLKVGESKIDDNGHLIMHDPETDNDPEVRDDGHLIVNVN